MPIIGRHVAKLSGYAPALPTSGDVTRPSRLRFLVGPDFRLLSDDDALGLA
jgi:hypothetical protein